MAGFWNKQKNTAYSGEGGRIWRFSWPNLFGEITLQMCCRFIARKMRCIHACKTLFSTSLSPPPGSTWEKSRSRAVTYHFPPPLGINITGDFLLLLPYDTVQAKTDIWVSRYFTVYTNLYGIGAACMQPRPRSSDICVPPNMHKQRSTQSADHLRDKGRKSGVKWGFWWKF